MVERKLVLKHDCWQSSSSIEIETQQVISTAFVDLEVSDGTRTHDRLDHNQELYQLSYAHHGVIQIYQRAEGWPRA